MKRTVLLALVVALIGGSAPAQSKKPANRTGSRPRTVTKKPAQPGDQTAPRVLGSQVHIVTRNGDQILGELIDLTTYSIRIRADRLESTIALDTIQSLSFGTTDVARPSSSGAVSPDFARDASVVLGVFQTTATSLQSGIDYTEFGRQVTELRRVVEKFISRYSSTENASESRVTSLVAAGLTDYNWSRTIWTLKFGRSGDGAALESDSTALADALATYPELKAAGGGGNRYSIERVIAGLWQKAGEKAEKARLLSVAPR